jgi:hypothetical protein
LYAGYESAAGAIDVAGGALDGIGLGEWIHGGDVREPLGADDPYASAGSDLAVGLLVERSVLRRATRVAVDIDGVTYLFGVGSLAGTLRTDVETFVRLTSGRRPDPARYELADVGAGDLILFA